MYAFSCRRFLAEEAGSKLDVQKTARWADAVRKGIHKGCLSRRDNTYVEFPNEFKEGLYMRTLAHVETFLMGSLRDHISQREFSDNLLRVTFHRLTL